MAPEISLYYIVFGSGIIAFAAWLAILTMIPHALVLGIISLIQVSRSKGKHIPMSLKLLFIMPILYFFLGMIGSIWSSALAYEIIEAGRAGPARGSSPIYSLLSSLYLPLYTFFGMFIFLFFIIVAIIIMHSKNAKKDGPGGAP